MRIGAYRALWRGTGKERVKEEYGPEGGMRAGRREQLMNERRHLPHIRATLINLK